MIGIGLLAVLSVASVAGMLALIHKAREPLARKDYAGRVLLVVPVILVWSMTDMVIVTEPELAFAAGGFGHEWRKLVVVANPGFAFSGTAPMIMIVCILFFLWVYHWTARRLLDVGVSKWWAVAMNVIPFVGLLVMLVLCFVRSQPREPAAGAG